MLSEPSDVCDFGRTRISSHESNSCLNWPLWLQTGVGSTEGVKKSVLLLQMACWTANQRRAVAHVSRQSWAAEFSRAQMLFWMEKKGRDWLLVKDSRKYIDLGGRRWWGKRKCLAYTMERTAPHCRHCIPEGLYFFTDLYVSVLAETGIKRCFSSVDKNKCPWVLVHVMQKNHREVRYLCSLSLLFCRPQRRAVSDTPLEKQSRFTGLKAKLIGK